MKNSSHIPKSAPRSSAMPRSVQPSRNGSFLGFSGFQFIYMPSATGESRRIVIPKFFAFLLFISCFGAVGSFGAMVWYTKNTKELAQENKRLREENHSIRSEASVIISKLQEVQSNLTKVDLMSDQVRAEASQLESAPVGARKLKMSESSKKKSSIKKPDQKLEKTKTESSPEESALNRSFRTLISPGKNPNKDGNPGTLVESESKNGTALKIDALEFKDLFVALNNVTDKSSSQAETLELLLSELQIYRTKISLTPTIAPVKGTVTSSYGLRVSPFTGSSRMHQGLDIAAPLGSSIRSAANGTVTKVTRTEDYGIYVEVTHGFGVLSRYAHASKITVKVGEKVKKGQEIGLVGMTGRTTGPHLHYEVEINGRKTNPGEFIR